jgi:hypothetical protein
MNNDNPIIFSESSYYERKKSQKEIFEDIKRMHKLFPEMCSGKECYCNDN